MTIRVVRAFLNDHEVVAVNCSPLPTRPWTAVDLAKGWTIPCREEDLTDPQPLECRAPVNTGVMESGVASVGEKIMASLAKSMPAPTLPGLSIEARLWLQGDPAPSFDEDQWRVTSCDDDPFTAEAPEAWAYFVDRIDRYGFVDRIEHRVDDTWRVRSIRDLLEAAGGDPL